MPLTQSDHFTHTKIFDEQVAHLYKNAPLSYVFSIVNGLVLVIMQRPVIESTVLVAWFSTLCLITLLRTALVLAYRLELFRRYESNFWHRTYIFGTGLAGIVWCGATVLLFPEDNSAHQLFVIFMLAGMTAASISVLSVCLSAFYIFSIPILISLAVQIYQFGDSFAAPMSAMVVFYLIGLSVAAKQTHRTILTSLILRFDNNALTKEILERQVAEEALYQQKERLQITFSAIAEGVVTTDSKGFIESMNPAAEKISGWSNSDAVGRKINQIFNYSNEATGNSQTTAILDSLSRSERVKKNSLLETKSGSRRLIEEIASPLNDSLGNIVGSVAIIRDITQATENSRQLLYQASHDALTGLPNRTLLCDRLEHAISKALRAERMVAVLFMDLNRFKQVNDSFGHAAGDKLLSHVARQIYASIREEDTVARLGGDEFVVVLEDIKHQHEVTLVAHKVINNLAVPISIEGQEISVSVSIGIALFPRDGTDVDSLLKHADTAMYRTKELGQADIQFYSIDMSLQALDRLKKEQQLQSAVTSGELELFYLPRVDMDKRTVFGVEALIRWRTSANTLVSPADFIHIAEETGVILRIGEWVLYNACHQLKHWHNIGFKNLRMAVNLSARQVRSVNIVELVKKVLQDTQLQPQHLELDITETLFSRDAEHAIIALRNLKKLGVKLAIDDFGTGYSSLVYIKRLPIDILKIDRSFIHDIIDDPVNAAIVPAIVAVGRKLNLEVIAEGVENETQRQYLKNLACGGFQGYLFCKPLPAPQMTEFLYSETTVN